jgi:DNA-binding transcriptional regulator GbsR (MarR family)
MSAMKKIESSKIREQIEETGRTIEKFGLSPMNGRILALFTVTDSSELTFEEIVSFFSSSKSVVSNSLNYLLTHKFIDYKTYNTGRKRYFYLTDKFFIVYFKDVLTAMCELREEIYKTLSKRSPANHEVNTRMLKWVENANIFEESINSALEKTKNE